jgi:hypothetical protein
MDDVNTIFALLLQPRGDMDNVVAPLIEPICHTLRTRPALREQERQAFVSWKTQELQAAAGERAMQINYHVVSQAIDHCARQHCGACELQCAPTVACRRCATKEEPPKYSYTFY